MNWDESAPYPRPDYNDAELDTKEMINGTFAKAAILDVQNFRPVLDRYNVTQNRLVDMTAARLGKVTPEMLDINLSDPTLSGVKEVGYLPYKVEVPDNDAEKIYDPRRYYNQVEFINYETTILQNVPYMEDTLLNIPYYDKDNAGLFGFREYKDDDGNITKRTAAFYSLVRNTITELGEVPTVEFDGYSVIGYVKGGLVIQFGHNGNYTYVSFLLDGRVASLTINNGGQFASFGDHGEFAVEGATSTFIYNIEMELVSTVDDLACRLYDVNAVTGNAKYPFGIDMDGGFYFIRSEDTSYFWKRVQTDDGAEWKVKVVNNPKWKYRKKVLWDYFTDGWLEKPLRRLKYNLLKHGVWKPAKLPTGKMYPDITQDMLEFRGSDTYGDFIMVVQNGTKVLKHTYDFSVWSDVTDDAVDGFYQSWDRIWVNGRSDNIVGYAPYMMDVITSTDENNNYEPVMKLRFKGFVFRRVV